MHFPRGWSRDWSLPASTIRPILRTFPFGAHVAVVELDAETGVVAVRRYVAVDEVGNIVNPMIVEGQVHGGM